MRVNVYHPMFSSDQHLVAESREVKMGPKALSRSLGSLNGVDKNRISPTYTLNTGHTYFFYDKNTFLKKRLALLIEEMKFRGFATNHTELIDDSYEYHPDTFNAEWWNDWVPTKEALEINLERIAERFNQKDKYIKTRGWYKLFGYPVRDFQSIVRSRKKGNINICCNCKSIVNEADLLDPFMYCWNCNKKLTADDLEIVELKRREGREVKNGRINNKQKNVIK